MIEIWKKVNGFGDKYYISNYGNIKNIKTNKLLNPKKDKDGYLEIALSNHCKKKYYRVHRLVAEYFIPNINNKPQINHKDRNKANNKVDNLEWCTNQENAIHCFKTGRKIYTRKINQYTKDLIFVKQWNSIKDASKTLKISHNNISSCCSNKLKTAGGYIWKYKEVDI